MRRNHAEPECERSLGFVKQHGGGGERQWSGIGSGDWVGFDHGDAEHDQLAGLQPDGDGSDLAVDCHQRRQFAGGEGRDGAVDSDGGATVTERRRT